MEQELYLYTAPAHEKVSSLKWSDKSDHGSLKNRELYKYWISKLNNKSNRAIYHSNKLIMLLGDIEGRYIIYDLKTHFCSMKKLNFLFHFNSEYRSDCYRYCDNYCSYNQPIFQGQKCVFTKANPMSKYAFICYNCNGGFIMKVFIINLDKMTTIALTTISAYCFGVDNDHIVFGTIGSYCVYDGRYIVILMLDHGGRVLTRRFCIDATNTIAVLPDFQANDHDEYPCIMRSLEWGVYLPFPFLSSVLLSRAWEPAGGITAFIVFYKFGDASHR